jgi:hypothetical protein
MRVVILLWGPIILVHGLMGLANLFTRQEQSVRFSAWARSAIVNATLFIGAIFFDTTSQGRAQGIGYGVLIILIFCYFGYACFMFGYEYDGSRLRWFNGIVVRRVYADAIREVTMLSDKRRIAKVELILRDRRVRLRNDLPDVAGIVKRIASDRSIPISNARLPWWSV